MVPMKIVDEPTNYGSVQLLLKIVILGIVLVNADDVVSNLMFCSAVRYLAYLHTSHTLYGPL